MQNEHFGPFSKQSNATIPFFCFKNKCIPDMRFATNMTGGTFVPESKQLVELTQQFILLGTSASGKTRAIFDVARQKFAMFAIQYNAKIKSTSAGEVVSNVAKGNYSPLQVDQERRDTTCRSTTPHYS